MVKFFQQNLDYRSSSYISKDVLMSKMRDGENIILKLRKEKDF